MTKVQLIDALAVKCSIQKNQAETFIDGFSEVLAETLVNGEKTNLAGLGVFSVKDCQPRIARNPKTGAAVNVPAMKKVRFKASSILGAKLAAQPITAQPAAAKPAA